ncbi:hypothetical protein MRX96_029753 [Rhipicephalus microplus]
MSSNTTFQNSESLLGENGSAVSLAVGEELTFTTQSLVQVIIYCILFVIAGAGNVPVFVSLLNKRHRKSRIKLMILHLAIADLIVTFVMIPLEVVWRLTVPVGGGQRHVQTDADAPCFRPVPLVNGSGVHQRGPLLRCAPPAQSA